MNIVLKNQGQSYPTFHLQCNPVEKEQMFPYPMTALHHRIQHITHWQNHTNTGKLNRIGPQAPTLNMFFWVNHTEQ